MTCPVQWIKLSLWHHLSLLAVVTPDQRAWLWHSWYHMQGPRPLKRGAVRLIEESVSRALISLMAGSGVVVSKANIRLSIWGTEERKNRRKKLLGAGPNFYLAALRAYLTSSLVRLALSLRPCDPHNGDWKCFSLDSVLVCWWCVSLWNPRCG